MKTKLVYMLVMFCLVVAAVGTAPPKALACSGDDCACNVDEQQCLEECPPPEDPNYQACRHACIQLGVHCAICCCCDTFCPAYC